MICDLWAIFKFFAALVSCLYYYYDFSLGYFITDPIYSQNQRVSPSLSLSPHRGGGRPDVAAVGPGGVRGADALEAAVAVDAGAAVVAGVLVDNSKYYLCQGSHLFF